MARADLHLAVPARRDAIEPTRLAVLEYLAPIAPSAKAAYQIELILEESLMNIVWHAFADEGSHMIDVGVAVEDHTIELRFEDDGRAFDPTQAAAPTLPASLDQASPGGLGLMLVRSFAKSMDYQRIDGRNRLTICVQRG